MLIDEDLGIPLKLLTNNIKKTTIRKVSFMNEKKINYLTV